MITRRGFFGLLAALPVLANWQIEPFPLPIVDEAWGAALTPVNSAYLGLQYWQAPSNSGTWLGLERSAYPGRPR
jgi:hypothetical protein